MCRSCDNDCRSFGSKVLLNNAARGVFYCDYLARLRGRFPGIKFIEAIDCCVHRLIDKLHGDGRIFWSAGAVEKRCLVGVDLSSGESFGVNFNCLL